MTPILLQIMDEAERAHKKYGSPTSTHESLGVMLEEFDELRQAIQANDREAITKEALQVAAVAYRLALICSLSSEVLFSVRSGLRIVEAAEAA